jgi:hypothetical protein
MVRHKGRGFWRKTSAAWRAVALLLTLAFGASAGSSGLLPVSAAADGWTIECVDCPKFFQTVGNRGLQVDAEGHVHVAYAGGDFLYYASFDGASWSYDTVGECAQGDSAASLVLDATGQPHIGYTDDSARAMYAQKDAAGWHVEVVGDGSEYGSHPSLALDADAEPHMSWFGYDEMSLMHAHKDGGGWHVQTVHGPSDGGWTSSIALDGDGYPHITYEHGGSHDDTDLMYFSWGDSAWQIETVDTLGGGFSSLVLDEEGRPHVSYYADGNVRYAFREDSSWQTEVVGAGTRSSLVLDGTGVPQISYIHMSTGELLYGYRDGTAWQIEMVDVYYRDGTALAMDADGDPHIAAISGVVLNYARLDDPSTWDIEPVESSASVGMAPSLAIDGEDYAHMTYNGNMGVQYVREDASGWHFETIAWGGASSLALDGAGEPHVSYAVTRFDPGSAPYWEVIYARRDVAGWHFEIVASDLAEDEPSPPTLALDSTGSPHIGFWNRNDGELKYAYREGDAWHVETADGSGGSEVSLAQSGDGFPHLSYVRDETLLYAYRDATGWTVETVDDSTGGPRYSSLALDDDGYPHISYYDSSADDLRYAHQDSDGWHLDTVDDWGDVGRRSSLVLDEAGHPHISYYDGGYFAPPVIEYRLDLKYARWDGAAWQIETVDSDGDVGDYSSLALDSAGRPHIGYHDTSHQDLKCAYFYSAQLEVPVDVKPHSCPNPLNVKVRGSLPVAVLSTESFDIRQIDPASVRLEGVAPLTWSEVDIATPYEPFTGKVDALDCTDEGADGYVDLRLKFSVPELVASLGEVGDGDVLVLRLTGALKEEYGGTFIVGEDVVFILKRGKQ